MSSPEPDVEDNSLLDQNDSTSNNCEPVEELRSVDNAAEKLADIALANGESEPITDVVEDRTMSSPSSEDAVAVDNCVLDAPSTEDGKSLIERGLSPETVEFLETMFSEDLLQLSDVDDPVVESLKTLPLAGLIHVRDRAREEMASVSVKSAFLVAAIASWTRDNSQQPAEEVLDGSEDATSSAGSSGDDSRKNSSAGKTGPDERKLRELVQMYPKFNHDVTVGQRRLGPPLDWPKDLDPPGIGHEIFVGKVPKDVFEDSLVPLFSAVGELYDLRVMIEPNTHQGRGFCFVSYKNKEDAVEAVNKFHDYEIKPNRRLQVNLSTPNKRLFLGNIPKNKDQTMLSDELTKTGIEGIVNVIVYTIADDPKKKNRGFCFLEFKNHAAASSARRKLLKNPKIWNNDVVVDWADPQDEPDEETMRTVKVLYVSNLTSDVSEDVLTDTFKVYGSLERVKKVKDYGFIHFDSRESALSAMQALNGAQIGRNKVMVTLAKPVSEKTKMRKEERRRQQPYHSQGVQPPGGHPGWGYYDPPDYVMYGQGYYPNYGTPVPAGLPGSIPMYSPPPMQFMSPVPTGAPPRGGVRRPRGAPALPPGGMYSPAQMPPVPPPHPAHYEPPLVSLPPEEYYQYSSGYESYPPDSVYHGSVGGVRRNGRGGSCRGRGLGGRGGRGGAGAY